MKKALGIILDSKTITMALIEENGTKLEFLKLTNENLKIPINSDDADSLLQFMKSIQDIITCRNVTDVYFLKAGISPMGKGPSTNRIKAEASIQIASKELKINVTPIAPQTLKAANKRAEKNNEKPIEEILGKDFSSKVKREAAEVAILGLKKAL